MEKEKPKKAKVSLIWSRNSLMTSDRIYKKAVKLLEPYAPEKMSRQKLVFTAYSTEVLKQAGFHKPCILTDGKKLLTLPSQKGEK